MSSTKKRPKPADEECDPPEKTAFIAAPTASVARSIRKGLQKVGVDALTTFEADEPGRTITEITADCISKSDFVVAVLGEGPMVPNVFFELGMAFGLGKRTLIFVSQEKAVLTARSLGAPYVLVKSEDVAAVASAVTEFLGLPQSVGKIKKKPEPQTQPIDDLADQLLAEVRSWKGKANDTMLTQVLRRAIEASGVSAVSAARQGDLRADLAVWSDDVEPWVQNPVLIEVKADSQNMDPKTVAKQLTRYMDVAHVFNALVIYGGHKLPDTDLVHLPNIYFVSLEEFLESLRDSSFGDVVRGLRNRNVHGVS